MKPNILIVDDEDTIRKLLKSRLERENNQVVLASNSDEAEKILNSGDEFGILITDLKMPGKNGFELLSAAKEKFSHLRVIVITGHGEKEAAVQALRRGAFDYLEKPFDLDELSHSVKRALHEFQLEKENLDLVGRLEARIARTEGKNEDEFWFVSKDPSMDKVNEWLNILRRESLRGTAEEPLVLILGESGTGKEGVARMIHFGSRRAKGPWIAINCANFSEQLLESELFGHERGAFTSANSLKRGLLEIAKGGTLFLDELGEMDTKLQAKLLRVLQEKIFRRVGGTVDIISDVRVIAATNKNLLEHVRLGKFREDLYHRLSQVVIEIPPLRKRIGDILLMANQFAERAFKKRGKTFQKLSPEAEKSLLNYNWPGNVRELLNVIERLALVWSGNSSIPASFLSLPSTTVSSTSLTLVSGTTAALPVSAAPFGGSESYMDLKKRWCSSFEREYLIAALSKHGGNVSATARAAKLDRSNLLRLLRRHGLSAQQYRKAA